MKLPNNWIKSLEKRGWVIDDPSGLSIKKIDNNKLIAQIDLDYFPVYSESFPDERIYSYVVTAYCDHSQGLEDDQESFRKYQRAQLWYFRLSKKYDKLLGGEKLR